MKGLAIVKKVDKKELLYWQMCSISNPLRFSVFAAEQAPYLRW